MQLRIIVLSKTVTLLIFQCASIVLLIIINISKVHSAEICVEDSRICLETAATRIINGESIYKDCWKYDITYNCYDDISTTYTDNCTSIRNINTCSQSSSECEANLDSGICLSYKNNFSCSLPIDNYESLNLILEALSQVITSEYLDDSACNIFSLNSDCILTSPRTCTGGQETKTINGLDIVRDCWNYQETYACQSNVDECNELENNSDCTYSSEECLSQNNSGTCTYLTKSYQCPITITSEQSKITCGSQTYCIGDNCQTIEYQKNQDFSKAVSSAAILEESASDLSEDGLSTFTGKTHKCGKDLLSYEDCCKISGWAEDVVKGFGYVASASIATGVALGAVSPMMLIVIPPAIAISQAADSFNICSTSERELYIKKEVRQCVYVGSYCSERIELGFDEICLKKKKSYCCFNSKISRIIHEQGRPQIGRGWGSAESPDCSGLRIEELDRIDFTKINFGELAADIERNVQQNIPDVSTISAQISSTVSNYYSDYQGVQDE